MASTVEGKAQSEIPISTINVRVTGHPLDPTNTGQIIKPGELVDFIEPGKEKLLRVHLIGSNTDEKEEQGFFYWTFSPELISIIENSRIWAKLKSQVMYALSSKYSLRLYELVDARERRVLVGRVCSLTDVPKSNVRQ